MANTCCWVCIRNYQRTGYVFYEHQANRMAVLGLRYTSIPGWHFNGLLHFALDPSQDNIWKLQREASFLIFYVQGSNVSLVGVKLPGIYLMILLAVSAGFEPAREFLPNRFSRPAP